ncbi:MAG: acyltransferase [Terracidiphilus sp.]
MTPLVAAAREEDLASPKAEAPRSLKSKPVEALPAYYPALDGLRAFSVLFVVFEHVNALPTPMRHFHGYLGVDIFFVLSGFLITGLLLREERLTGKVDLAGFYIRRAFRILPLYWFVLASYVVMLQPASKIEKWTQMKAALPYFLTFNNDIPLILMPDRVGTVFGLSWTLGIEEKFYFCWPLICFFLLGTLRKRFFAGWMLYGSAVALAFFSFKMGRSYSGLIVGAILAMLFANDQTLGRLKHLVSRIPAMVVAGLIAIGFWLVDVDERAVFIFSWIIGLTVASVLLKKSWLSRLLSVKWIVWFGKRSYAMYLIQGFAIEFLLLFYRPASWMGEIGFAVGAFLAASAGAALLHRFLEEPARRLGKRIVAVREQRRKTVEIESPALPVLEANAE